MNLLISVNFMRIDSIKCKTETFVREHRHYELRTRNTCVVVPSATHNCLIESGCNIHNYVINWIVGEFAAVIGDALNISAQMSQRI